MEGKENSTPFGCSGESDNGLNSVFIMGLYFGMRNSIRKSGSNYEAERTSEFDPNPTKFTIRKYNEQNGNLAILVNYPNCKNYEGDKIIVYKNTTWEQVRNLNELDPHFTDETTIKPFARFEPTAEGWMKAVELLNVL